MSRSDRHNEMNPDMRSFGHKGTTSVNPHDEAERKYQDEQDDIRSNADEPDDDSDEDEDEDEMTEADMHASMWQPGE
tara:strand:+ start:1109 stop:1339 length:231 start_codon:yes stop_codon:yes gene_type:complete